MAFEAEAGTEKEVTAVLLVIGSAAWFVTWAYISWYLTKDDDFPPFKG